MSIVPHGQDLSTIELSVKNKFRWDWLDENDINGDRVGAWGVKITKPGVVKCIPCNRELIYRSNGIGNYEIGIMK